MKIQPPRLSVSYADPDPRASYRITLLPRKNIMDIYGLPTRFGEVLWLPGRTENSDPPDGGFEIVQSSGEIDSLSPEDYRTAGGILARWLADHPLEEITIHPEHSPSFARGADLGAYLEGLWLGSYTFQEFKQEQTSTNTVVNLPKDLNGDLPHSVDHALAVAESVNYARSLAQQPPNVINPSTLADEAEDLADSFGLSFTRIRYQELDEMGAGAILSVGQGSKTPSELLVLEHRGREGKDGRPPIIVVGKAITFDTGGYTIKKLFGMASMKYDKCGGAAILGVMRAAASLDMERRVIGIVAAAENMISSQAYRPNDIVRSLSGQTIEIISTDAEGRLVLADALTYACRKYEPAAMVDLATLTGGVVTALGSVRAGLMSNNASLAAALFESGERTHERLWQLPLDEDYFELIRGRDSDLRNSSHLPEGMTSPASTIVGGMFLKQFIEGDQPWAHIDIAATATSSGERPYSPRGPTGFGVRLLIDFIESFP
ncbi:MAG TPA: leucyl aminopeptidase family protein [Anaerolineales bacterium]|nr:leucyl aminopeptidase family protein [Anaerolineales bacterium]